MAVNISGNREKVSPGFGRNERDRGRRGGGGRLTVAIVILV